MQLRQKWNTGLRAFNNTTQLQTFEHCRCCVLFKKDFYEFMEIMERFNDLIFSLKPFCGTLNIDSAFRWKVMSDYNSHCTGNQDSAIWSIKEGTCAGRLDHYPVPGKNAADISQVERFYSLSGLLAKTWQRTPFICLYITPDFNSKLTPQTWNMSEI